ncbi:hypothetical protein AGMMS49921_01050 [Endomicrobiia bacterium]|nr:hypothetical protein AGMMS49921_01050 [Endomicrobiia bacterium]
MIIDQIKKAEQGVAEAQYSLGVMYGNGYRVKQDYKEAFNWFKKAAEQGHSDAKTALTKIPESK